MIFLRSLGQCEIDVGGVRLTPTSQTLFATALYLAVEGARPIPREQLLTLLWPDTEDDKATHSLRQMFYRLRAQGVPLDGDTARVVLPAGAVGTDYDELLAPGVCVPSDRLLERIPGGFLPGYMPRASRSFAEWVEVQRARVNAALRRQLVAEINARRAAGEWPATEAIARRCLELDPLNEEATLACAEALAMDGSKARAIAMIDRYMYEIGPRGKEIHLPATMLRKRISELYPLPPVIERDPPQIGRDVEMEKLDAALKDARRGSGSAFVISGPPGIGKTRLVTEFTRAAQLQGIRIARTGMGHHDDHRPLGAWTDLVPLMQQMPGALGCDPESLPYLKRLTTYDSNQTTPSPETQDAEYLFARIRLSILDLIGAVASESCVILLVEDVHWMDEWSWDVMSALSKRLQKLGLLILMTRRDSDVGATPLPKDAVLRELPLAPLDDERCRKLLGAVGPASRVSEEDFVEWCVRTSAGNPYFLIELGRRASKTDGRFQAPPSLTRLIGQRFLDVAPLSRRVLQAAAVLGKNSTLARLERVLDERRVALLDSLDELARHSLILADRERVLCRHDLLGMSALAEISPLSLQLLHRHAAEALEAEIDNSSTPTHLWDCATLWQAAGQSELALSMMDRCATRAMEMGAAAEAARVLSHMIGVLPQGETRWRTQQKLVRALYLTGEAHELLATANEMAAFKATNDGEGDEHTPEELMELDSRSYVVGPTAETLQRLIRCAQNESATADHRVQAALNGCKIADAHFDSSSAHTLFVAVRSLASVARRELEAEFRLIFHGSFGRTEESAEAARELHALLNHEAARAPRARALSNAAFGLFLNGDLEEAFVCATEGFQMASELQLTGRLRHCAFILGAMYLALGDIDGASRALAAQNQVLADPGPVMKRQLLDHQIRLAVLKGDLDRARALLPALEETGMPTWPRGLTHITGVVSFVRILDGWRPNDSELQELIRLHYRAREHDMHDFYVLMLIHAFEARKQSEAGVKLARRYIERHRVERFPVLPHLVERIT